jgi:5-(carboxyamino)imidazole ribonucleotide synthase
MTVGILGGGQLGLMLGEAARNLGISCVFLDPSPDAPAKSVGAHIVASYDDQDSLRALAASCDVITFEFENVSAPALTFLTSMKPCFPSVDALIRTRDRISEKDWMQACGIPTASYRRVETPDDLAKAIDAIGLPLIIKTRTLGYDGKGQMTLSVASKAEEACLSLGGKNLIAEERIAFDRELSLISVRSTSGDIVHYPLVHNTHVNGILDTTIAPADGVKEVLQQKAQGYAQRLMNDIAYVGVMTIEFFEKDGTLIGNEIAPRVHNSGHWSIEGAQTSQFENHLRAITGMSLQPTSIETPCTMLNLIGTVADATALHDLPNVFIHVYGKSPRAGRKLGHVTIKGKDEETIKKVLAWRKNSL